MDENWWRYAAWIHVALTVSATAQVNNAGLWDERPGKPFGA
jgi:hypothetical protein